MCPDIYHKVKPHNKKCRPNVRNNALRLLNTSHNFFKWQPV